MNNVVPITGNALPALLRRRVSQDAFFEGVEWFIHGVPLKQIAELWVVPVDLVKRLVPTKEFRDTVRAMRDDVLGNELAVLTRSVHISLRQCVERLEGGDAYVAADGTLAYKPISARDAASIAAMLLDRRDKIEDKLAPKGEDAGSAVSDLVAVAAALDAFKRTRDAQRTASLRPVIDVEPLGAEGI